MCLYHTECAVEDDVNLKFELVVENSLTETEKYDNLLSSVCVWQDLFKRDKHRGKKDNKFV
jgi:hypothetical protein